MMSTSTSQLEEYFRDLARQTAKAPLSVPYLKLARKALEHGRGSSHSVERNEALHALNTGALLDDDSAVRKAAALNIANAMGRAPYDDPMSDPLYRDVLHFGGGGDFKAWLASTPGALTDMRIRVSGVNKGKTGTVIGDQPTLFQRHGGRGPSLAHVIEYSAHPALTAAPRNPVTKTAILASSRRRLLGKAWEIVIGTAEEQERLVAEYNRFNAEQEEPGRAAAPVLHAAAARAAAAVQSDPRAADFSVVGGSKRRTRRRRRGRHGKRSRKTSRKTRSRRRRGRSTCGRRRR